MILPSAISGRRCVSLNWSSSGTAKAPCCHTQGTLWGGNLAMLVSLIGTPWLPAIDDGILVVEDINEHPFRVERMLLQLMHCGILARQKALVGSFTSADPNEYDAGYNLNTDGGVPASSSIPADNRTGVWSRARDRHALVRRIRA
jgi:muramoyltetrapeptide carboxypeptidase LdcA involved in peptidoglycan recycling